MWIRFLLVLFALTLASAARAGMISVGKSPTAGADGVVVRWLGTDETDVRVAVQLEAARLNVSGEKALLFGPSAVFPLEVVASYDLGSGEMELTRAKTALLRTALLQKFPIDLLTAYRDLDRGIAWGADLLALRVPVRLTDDGEIVLQPGLELGLRRYGEEVDATALHASFVLEASAAYEIVQAWLSTGILARARFDLATKGMSGDEESAMGFLALALDDKNRLSFRLYGGVERDANRGDLGLPTTNLFIGSGFFGNFGAR